MLEEDVGAYLWFQLQLFHLLLKEVQALCLIPLALVDDQCFSKLLYRRSCGRVEAFRDAQ